MLQVKRFVVNPLGENCYLVWDEKRECAVIDCGVSSEDKINKIVQFIDENNLTPVLSLQTHMHFDHVWGLPHLYRIYGLRPQCHVGELNIYAEAADMARDLFGADIFQPMVPVQAYLTDGQELKVGDSVLQVLHTPGHTPGGVSFYCAESKVLFSGDTLFQGSVGRADLPGGDMEQELNSVRQRILSLPDDVTVYPGHGGSTSVGEERMFNPYL